MDLNAELLDALALVFAQAAIDFLLAEQTAAAERCALEPPKASSSNTPTVSQ